MAYSPHDVHVDAPAKLYVAIYFPVPQAVQPSVSVPELPAAENFPAGHVEHCPTAVATFPVSSYLPAGQACRGWRTSGQPQSQSTALGFKATGTIGTRSVSKKQDEKRPRVWRITWQVLEVAVTLPK